MLKLKAKVGSKGQVVIPKPIREKIGIKEGRHVYFYIKDSQIILEKMDGERFLQEYLQEVKEKKPEPKEIDWDQEYYKQLK